MVPRPATSRGRRRRLGRADPEVAPEEVAALAVKSTSELDGTDAVPIEELHGNDEQTLPHLVGDLATASEPEAVAARRRSSAPDGEAAPDLGGAPDAGISPGGLESVIESLLFVSDRPLTLADSSGWSGERDRREAHRRARGAAAPDAADSGIQVIAVAGGWQLRTHPENVGLGVAPGRRQAAAADARDAGDAGDRRLPPAGHAPGDRRRCAASTAARC